MRKLFPAGLILLVLCITSSMQAESTLVKNATVYLPTGSFQTDAYILVKGAKVVEIGSMEKLKQDIFDFEYDLKGAFVYPAFIDPFFQGMQKRQPAQQPQAGGRGQRTPTDKTSRKPLAERDYFIFKRVIDQLELKESEAKKPIASGFGFIHVIPSRGIMGGTSAVISLAKTAVREAILVPDRFMYLALRTSRGGYPTTLASLVAELQQLKFDTLNHDTMANRQQYHPTERLVYNPELEALLPYFQKKKQFLIQTRTLVDLGLVELIQQQLDIAPVLIGHADIWRAEINPAVTVILPLAFKAPSSSFYAQRGDAVKKEAEKTLYPEKLTQFFKEHNNLCLTAPTRGAYSTLFKNIRILIKNGVSEKSIIDALTVKPARLLDISHFTGQIKTGNLASFFVSDKKVFEDKAKIVRVFVEGKMYDFTPKKKKTEKEAAKKGGVL